MAKLITIYFPVAGLDLTSEKQALAKALVVEALSHFRVLRLQAAINGQVRSMDDRWAEEQALLDAMLEES